MIFCYQATGEDFSVEPAEERRPFRALLDVGLIRTTTGNRVFGALKVYSFFIMNDCIHMIHFPCVLVVGGLSRKLFYTISLLLKS
jgi:hypothetical protein